MLNIQCTKFDVGWGSGADPVEGVYSVLQTF